MNSESDNLPIISAPQTVYVQSLYSHSSLDFQTQYPNTFGQTISLGTSLTPIVVQIPPICHNLAQTLVEYDVTLPLVANRYIWTHQQELKECQHLQLYSSSNQFIVDADNLSNYIDIVGKAETSMQNFLTNDSSVGGLYPSNSVVNVVPALRNANASAVNLPVAANYPSSVNYVEPAYFKCGALGTAVTYHVSVPLSVVKNTYLSLDKTMYTGSQLYLKFFMGNINKVCYLSDSNAGPSIGTKTDYSGAATISNFRLQLAVETNVNQCNALINKINTTGMKLLIPYVQSYKSSNQGPSQTITQQFDSSSGRTLMKVFHVPYNNLENYDAAYDRSNVYGRTQKTLSYYTNLNGKREENLTINTQGGDPTNGYFYYDYLLMRKFLKGSVTSNLDVFQYNWFHESNYCDFPNQKVFDDDGNVISGVPLNSQPLQWAFVGNSMTSAAYQHYTFAIFSKKLEITPTMVSVS